MGASRGEGAEGGDVHRATLADRRGDVRSTSVRRTHTGDGRTFELDDDRSRVDVDALWAFLSTHAYWGRWRQRADVESQLQSAWRTVGAYEASGGAMVGFARAVSDGIGVAYLADVFVDERVRGHGLGVQVVQFMIDDGPGAHLRWMLHTRDAHGLYERFGFRPPDDTYLERPLVPPR